MQLVKNNPEAHELVRTAAQIIYRESPANPQPDGRIMRLAVWIHMTERGAFIITTRFNYSNSKGQPLGSSPSTSCFTRNNVDELVTFLNNSDVSVRILQATKPRGAEFTPAEREILNRPVSTWSMADKLIAFHALRQNRYS